MLVRDWSNPSMNEFGVFRPQELTKTSEQFPPKLKLSLDTRSHRLSMDSRSKHDRVEVQSKVDAPTAFDVFPSVSGSATASRYEKPLPLLDSDTGTGTATGTGN